jgi:hypothetical protein
MVNHLAVLVPAFEGASSCTRCFLHVINLVAKSLIHLFDIKKKDADAALANGVVAGDETHRDDLYMETDEDEDEATSAENDRDKPEERDNGDSEAVSETDNDEGWVNELDRMSAAERRELRESIGPLKLALVKASDLITVDGPALVAQLYSSDPETRLQNHSFEHCTPASLEANPTRPRKDRHVDATRCSDKMELYL